MQICSDWTEVIEFCISLIKISGQSRDLTQKWYLHQLKNEEI